MEKAGIKNKRVIFAKRQPPNLKNILCRAKFCSINETICEVKKCGSNCETCKLIYEGPTIMFHNAKYKFHVQNNFNCISRNLIYVITCNQCRFQYIGCTSRDLQSRMNVHRQQIRDASLRHLKVSKHIYECSKGTFNVYPFYKMKSNNKAERETKELYFINKFNPELNVD